MAVVSGARRLGPEPARRGRADQQDVSQFAVWEQIIRRCSLRPASRPILLVLDDLHWADPATLRVLRLLAESPARCRLLVLTTWRPIPSPPVRWPTLPRCWPGATPCGSSWTG